MNKKISVGVCISLIAIASTVAFVITWTVSLNMYNDTIRGVTSRDEISAKMQEIDSFVRNNYLYDIDDEQIANGVFSGYISGVGDKNTVYMTSDEYIRHSSEESGQLITAGVYAEKEASGYIQVAEVYPGSSAELSGIVKNDLIIAIDGIDVLEVEADAALKLLEGEENTKITLTVRRSGEDEKHSLIRQAIDIISVGSGVVNNVGFIRIKTFNALTAPQFEEALQSFAEINEASGRSDGGVRALLIDVRGNSSDFYTPVSDMVNCLINENTIAFTENRSGVRHDLIITDDSMVFPEEMQNIPIIILVDSSTAGAGELMTVVLKGYASAKLVGTNTAGDPYFRKTQPLKDSSAIRVTVAKIILAAELEFNDAGLTPDYPVETDKKDVSYKISDFMVQELAEIHDPQIRKAFEVIATIS